MYLVFLSSQLKSPSSCPLTTKIRTARPHLLTLTPPPAQTPPLMVNIISSFKPLSKSVLCCDRRIVWRSHVSSWSSWFWHCQHCLLVQACWVWCWRGYPYRGSSSCIFRMFNNSIISTLIHIFSKSNSTTIYQLNGSLAITLALYCTWTLPPKSD